MRRLQAPVRLVHITTVPDTLWAFFGGQIGYMRDRGFEVHAVSSPGKLLDDFAGREGIPVHAVDMPRRIAPLRDLVALWRLIGKLRRIRPTIVHAHTPKAGLLGMIAAWIARTPVRMYRVLGLPLMTATGLKRFLLWSTEKLACRLATQVYCDSPSLAGVLASDGICPADRVRVVANGSTNGTDAEGKFNPDRYGAEDRLRVRRQYGIAEDAPLIGFVGRIVRDKGIIELTQAWRSLREEFPDLRLVLVGPFEPQDPLPPDVEQTLRTDPRVVLTGMVYDMPPLYAAMDLLVLPTYREGFPNTPLEASAMGLPVVATRIPGCVDAVEDGVTGTLVPVRDASRLADAVRRYLRDPELRRRHGQAGRQRVLRQFRPEDVFAALHAEYVRLLRSRGLDAMATAG